MSVPKNMQELVQQLIGPTKSNREQILPPDDANSNESPDLQLPSRKSGQTQELEIKAPTPIEAAHRAVRCHHIKSNGLRCGSPALRDEIYCYFHRIWRHQPDCFPHRPDPNGSLFDLPLLENAEAVQLAIQQVLQALISNKIDTRRAYTLLFGLQTAASNVKRTHFDNVAYRKEYTTELK